MGVRPWRIVRPIAGHSKGREAGTVRRYVDRRLVHAAWAQAKARRNAPPGFAPSLADFADGRFSRSRESQVKSQFYRSTVSAWARDGLRTVSHLAEEFAPS